MRKTRLTESSRQARFYIFPLEVDEQEREDGGTE